jgi:hypothetical protein
MIQTWLHELTCSVLTRASLSLIFLSRSNSYSDTLVIIWTQIRSQDSILFITCKGAKSLFSEYKHNHRGYDLLAPIHMVCAPIVRSTVNPWFEISISDINIHHGYRFVLAVGCVIGVVILHGKLTRITLICILYSGVTRFLGFRGT